MCSFICCMCLVSEHCCTDATHAMSRCRQGYHPFRSSKGGNMVEDWGTSLNAKRTYGIIGSYKSIWFSFWLNHCTRQSVCGWQTEECISWARWSSHTLAIIQEAQRVPWSVSRTFSEANSGKQENQFLSNGCTCGIPKVRQPLGISLHSRGCRVYIDDPGSTYEVAQSSPFFGIGVIVVCLKQMGTSN